MEKKQPTVFPRSTDKNDGKLYGHNTTDTSQSTSSTVNTETQQPSIAVDNQRQKDTSETNEGQSDFVPHFQRICIGGEHNSGVKLYFIKSIKQSFCKKKKKQHDFIVIFIVIINYNNVCQIIIDREKLLKFGKDME